MLRDWSSVSSNPAISTAARRMPTAACHSAQMRKPKLECNVGDALVGGGGGQSDIEMREPDIAQHLRDRRSEMPLEAELQRTDTGACGFGQLRQVERFLRMRMEEFA